MKDRFGQASTFAYTPAIKACPEGIRDALRLEMESRLPLFAEDYSSKRELRKRSILHMVRPIVQNALQRALRSSGFLPDRSTFVGEDEYEQIVRIRPPRPKPTVVIAEG